MPPATASRGTALPSRAVLLFTMFDTNVLHEAGPCSFARCGQVYYAPFDEHFLPRLEKLPFRNGRRGPPETRMACGGGLYAQGVTCAA